MMLARELLGEYTISVAEYLNPKAVPLGVGAFGEMNHVTRPTPFKTKQHVMQ